MHNLRRSMILLFLILLSLVSTALLEATFTRHYGTEEGKVEALLGIASEVNASVVRIFKSLEGEAIEIPITAKNSFDQGNSLVQQATNLVEEGKYREASSTVVEALKLLKEALKSADEVMPSCLEPLEQSVTEALNLRATINRACGYLAEIELLLNETNTEGYDTDKLLGLVKSAKLTLDSALEELDILQIEAAKTKLKNAKVILANITELTERLTEDVKATKTLHFLAQTENRIDNLKANITAVSSQLPIQVKNASLESLNNAEDSLQEAKLLMEENKVEETVSELVKARENMEDVIDHLEEAGVIITINSEKNTATP